jgi:uncharacterized membrane protein YgcG
VGAGKRPEGLSPSQQQRIDHAVSQCREQNGLDVSVVVGDLNVTEPARFREAAETLHAALGEERARSAVLVVVAPGQRRVEIVTGPAARRRVPDRVAALAVLSMTTAFSGGDLAGGIVDGLRQVAEAAGKRAAIPAPPSARTALVPAHH